MAPFNLYTIETAPDASKEHLASAKATFGLIPNVEAVMAQAPALLGTYMTGWDLFGETSLSAAEQQIVYQTANFENNCGYCMPWHTILSEKAGLSKTDVEALRNGASLSDRKQEALRLFTRDLVRTNGNIAPASLVAFFADGYDQRSALEVILGLSIKLMSNYTNAIAQTPLDEAASHKKWQKPHLRG
ncbi:carboxymuconolactone decarboxylase family protein [Labrenzia sp. PHM005]|nr:carboxymuconolactone decarboxylase family protein [Labrenzia sp. PHM005]